MGGVSNLLMPGGKKGKAATLLTDPTGTAVGMLGLKKLSDKLSPDVPDAPAVEPVVAMPDPLAQQQAKRRSIVEQLSRSGRASTVLTSGTGKLGS